MYPKIGMVCLRRMVPKSSDEVRGDYELQNPNSINITRGFSKDKRPDLKQFLFGVVTTHDKIPVYANVTHGNTSDKTWNNNLLNMIHFIKCRIISPKMNQK